MGCHLAGGFGCVLGGCAAAGGEQSSQGVAGIDGTPAAHGPGGGAGILGLLVFLQVLKVGQGLAVGKLGPRVAVVELVANAADVAHHGYQEVHTICGVGTVGLRAFPLLYGDISGSHLLAEFLLDLDVVFVLIFLLLVLITLEAAHGVHCDEVVLVLAGYLLLQHLQLLCFVLMPLGLHMFHKLAGGLEVAVANSAERSQGLFGDLVVLCPAVLDQVPHVVELAGVAPAPRRRLFVFSLQDVPGHRQQGQEAGLAHVLDLSEPLLVLGPRHVVLELLLAAAVGFADVAEELKGLLRGRADCGRGGRGGVAGPGPRGEGYSAEGPAVTALQNGDLQGAPGTPHPQHLSCSFFTFSHIQATGQLRLALLHADLGTHWLW